MPRMLPKLYFAEATNNPSDAEEEILTDFLMIKLLMIGGFYTVIT